MRRVSTVSQTSIRLKGTAIPGAEDRQRLIPGWDQEAYSKASVLCVGAGGIISHIAPMLCRKGIGKIVLLDSFYGWHLPHAGQLGVLQRTFASAQKRPRKPQKRLKGIS
jgi:hypothetical protein